MLVYHGTNAVIGRIDLSICRNRTDFGKGFYLSDKIGTAQEWAVTRTGMRRVGIPTILKYSLNFEALKNLPGCRFPSEPSKEWLDFIGSNREFRQVKINSKEPRHDYHWVSGPIADDKMNDVVEEYLEGEISVDEAIRRAKALPQTFQLSLHTPEALSFVDENVGYRQQKNGRWLPPEPKWSTSTRDDIAVVE